MKEKILEILIDINEDIADYDGDNFFDDGMLDSLNVADLIAELNENFGVEVTAKYIKEENFKSLDAICALVEELQK